MAAVMWIFCCGMFRSASTLQFQITSRLVEATEAGYPIGWIDWKHFDAIRDTYAAQAGLKIVKVHVCSDTIAQEFRQNNVKGIYIYRDIRDVCASYLRQQQTSFESLRAAGFLETCLQGYQAWTSLPNVMVSQYDDVMRDLTQEVKRIAEHLDIEILNDQAEQIAAEYELEPQRQRVEQFKTRLLQTASGYGDRLDRDLVEHYDRETLLHANHIRSGRTGQWQQELSFDQAERIEARVKEWCADHQTDPMIFL